MSYVIYFDSAAIANAIQARAKIGSPTAILDVWNTYAQEMGAEIKVTDVVAKEMGPEGVPGSERQIFDDWRLQNNIGVTATDPSIVGKDAGERSILYDIKNSGRPLSDITILSDDLKFGDYTNLDRTKMVRDALGLTGPDALSRASLCAMGSRVHLRR